jgi:hypothetical protein
MVEAIQRDRPNINVVLLVPRAIDDNRSESTVGILSTEVGVISRRSKKLCFKGIREALARHDRALREAC